MSISSRSFGSPKNQFILVPHSIYCSYLNLGSENFLIYNEPERVRECVYEETSTMNQQQEEEEADFSPVSPLSQSLNSSTVTFIILAVFEFESPIDESETLDFLRNEFVPMSTRFSSIMVTDEKHVSRWKKVDIQVEDHLIVPTFPDLGLGQRSSKEEYDLQLKEYISKIGCERFPENKPLWDVHLIKYPSLNGVTSMVFKLSHAIGDGYSYAKLLFFAFKRVGNLSVPLSIPQISLRRKKGGTAATAPGKVKKLWSFVSTFAYFASDILWSGLKTTVLKDPPSAIRSETTKMELLRPINISIVTFSLERIKQIKSKLGATMTDVILGLISYMIHLYMMKMGQISYNDDSSPTTILVMINMRFLKGYKNMEEMIKAPDSWGNHSRFMPVSIPSLSCDLDKVNPLDFIIKARETMSKKKKSIYIHMIDPALKVLRSIKGQKGLDELVHTGFNNSSTMLTSLIGPKEQMAIGEHPINSFYFLVTGVPQSLTFTSVSCVGEFKLVATMEKGFIDSQVFSSCMDEAFQNLFEAAIGKDADEK